MELARADRCTGCGACVQACPLSCIHLSADRDGFLVPIIDHDTCANCGKCAKVCTVLQTQHCGQEPSAYAAYSKCANTRSESSSGGIFSEIAMQVLSCGGVVFGAAYDTDFSVKHICVESESDLWRLRGAKYAQSYTGNCYKDVKTLLESGQSVLFSGTPCQVAGLHSFLGRPYPNLLSVDIVCMGVPSPSVWQAYVQYRKEKDVPGAALAGVTLRSKENGWSRYRYSVRFAYSDGSVYRVPNQQDPYLRVLAGRYLSRSSCTNCRFKGLSRRSDITLGDFWGIWEYAPEMDDDGGTSLVFVHTAKGDRVIQQLGERIVWKEMALESTFQQNPAIVQSIPLADDHDRIKTLALNGKFDEIQRILTWKQKQASLQKKIQRVKNKILRVLHLKG